ncbi:MAG TPA: twin-arginine translocation signal domain-containing protein [Natrialbaceae archaeon]|nr:twin-arginine translocation signal domain-containing protein [Natrialbaceae archaeon]
MQSSRRSFLKTSGLAALLGVVGTAGCLETVNDAVGSGDESPGYAKWLYDPTEVHDSDYVGFGTFDLHSIYENEESVPEKMMQQVEKANENVEVVDLETMQSVTGIAYGHPKRDLGGGSMVVTGEFDAGKITAEIEEESTDEFEKSTHGEYTFYTRTQQRQYAEGDPDTNSATIAVSEDHVVMGGMQAPEASSMDAVSTMLDAEEGDVDSLGEGNEDAGELVSQLGDATLVLGGAFDTDPTTMANEGTPDELVEAVDDLVAAGVASDVDGDTVEHTMAFVYEDGDAASTDDVEAVFDNVEEWGDRAEDQLEDRSVSKDGRTLLVTATGDTEEFFQAYRLFGFGLTGTATVSGSASASQEVSVPQVAFEFTHREDGNVEITHTSGDEIRDGLLVRYQHDGDNLTERWEAGEGIMAGDRYVTNRTVDAGSQVSLVWNGEDGQSAVLGSYVVPE